MMDRSPEKMRIAIRYSLYLPRYYLPPAVSSYLPDFGKKETWHVSCLFAEGTPEAHVTEPVQKLQTILIVDDEPSVRVLFRSALKALPVRILDSDNGLDAMNLIEEEKPDLVITDYAMPHWDGLEVCHQIRKRSDLQHIKIVLITGQATPPFLLEAVNHGIVNAALPKPVNIDELQQLAKRLLARDRV
ncbi:MAG: response regulator [Nitrospirae bacterium]|nr:MAG: response regulator [Nitrospirota bacterium]